MRRRFTSLLGLAVVAVLLCGMFGYAYGDTLRTQLKLQDGSCTTTVAGDQLHIQQHAHEYLHDGSCQDAAAAVTAEAEDAPGDCDGTQKHDRTRTGQASVACNGSGDCDCDGTQKQIRSGPGPGKTA
jgi:hypothetical protein